MNEVLVSFLGQEELFQVKGLSYMGLEGNGLKIAMVGDLAWLSELGGRGPELLLDKNILFSADESLVGLKKYGFVLDS